MQFQAEEEELQAEEERLRSASQTRIDRYMKRNVTGETPNQCPPIVLASLVPYHGLSCH